MKKVLMLLMVMAMVLSANAGVILTGVIDGPYTGGHPKAVELYVNGTENLDNWTVINYNNGGVTPSNTTPLSGTYTDQYVYVMYDASGAGPAAFADIWGTSGDYANVITGAAPNHNGDDAIALHDNTGAIVDVYGVIGVDGTGTAWECLDSYAYRNNDTGPEITFNVSNWTVGAVDSLDGANNFAILGMVPFGTYTTAVDPNDITDPNIPKIDYTYGWEDGYGHVLGIYGNAYQPQNTTEQVSTGSYALKVTQNPIVSGQTSKAYLSWVKNLRPGDTVNVELDVFDNDSTPYNNASIAADYAFSDDITSAEYYAEKGLYVPGTSSYTQDLGWETLSTTFIFVGGIEGEPNAIVISALLNANWSSESLDYFFDNIKISAPEHAVVVLPPAYDPNDYVTYTYGWEDFDVTDPDLRETVLLGTYNNIYTGLQYDPFNISTRTGTNAMWISENDTDSNGRGYMAWITGLQNGDHIDASCFGRSYPGVDGGRVRMWAHYTYDDQDITSYAGSAGGHEGYSDPNGWTEFQKLYVFSDAPYGDDNRIPTGLVIEVRPYSTQGQGGYIDDISLTVPETAAVLFPSPDGDAICVGGLPQWDFNGDCIFNLLDLVTVIDDWLGCNLQPQEDCGL